MKFPLLFVLCSCFFLCVYSTKNDLVEAVLIFVGTELLHRDGYSPHVVFLPMAKLLLSNLVVGLATGCAPLGWGVVVGLLLDVFYVVEIAGGFPLA